MDHKDKVSERAISVKDDFFSRFGQEQEREHFSKPPKPELILNISTTGVPGSSKKYDSFRICTRHFGR